MGSHIRLLVRVDDAGSTHTSNMGCLRACEAGIARSVEVMMPGAWVHRAAELFSAKPEIDIGIHLTLSSEWDAIRWRPLTAAPGIVDGDGFFPPLVTERPGDPRLALAQGGMELGEIAAELEAQIALGVRLFPQASHVSSHMIRHFHELDRRLGPVVAELCHKYGLKDDAFGHGLPRIAGYPQQPRDGAARANALVETLTNLTDGTHILIDHPAMPSPELSALGHVGYRDVDADRIGCLEALTDARVLERVQSRGIELISYRDLEGHSF